MALVTFTNNQAPYLSAENLNNNFEYLDEKIDNGEIYSTQEIKTNRKWINGKTIYKKVIDYGYLPNASYKDVSSGLSNILVHKIYGYAISPNQTTIPLPFATTSANNNVSLVYTDLNYIRTQTGTDRSTQYAYIIIEYTKTTDEEE